MDNREVKPGYVDERQKSHKIPISELKIGMFVSKLDRDWMDTPFLMQGFVVETLEDIDLVAQYSEYVWVDKLTVEWVPPQSRAVANMIKSASYKNKTEAKQEHAQALSTYKQARRLTKTLLDDLRFGTVIDTDQVKETVNDCVGSVLRNPDALIWMSRMRSEDEYTAEHCLNVCILAIAFGRHLGMSEADLHKVGICGLLHDVGKMRVPPEILNKPDKLTDKEFNIIKAHSIHGRNLLMSSSGLPDIAIDVAYSHHEKVDGSGYPRKLSAAGISEFARIITIVDAYDAMTAHRCYSRAKASTEALKIIFKDRGTHFDDRLALEFIKCVGLYPPGTLVELINGFIGIVLQTNQKFRHLPKIIIIKNLNGELKKEIILDLGDIENQKLDKTYLIKRALTDGEHGINLMDYKERGLGF
ncbi:MAG: HD-GYP domain-containing protein [Cellvibrio sp.]|nr:HD-GYP domain-containing protein [Cellvibrio sp.]